MTIETSTVTADLRVALADVVPLFGLRAGYAILGLR